MYYIFSSKKSEIKMVIQQLHVELESQTNIKIDNVLLTALTNLLPL